jgi:hypothetical protein
MDIIGGLWGGYTLYFTKLVNHILGKPFPSLRYVQEDNWYINVA